MRKITAMTSTVMTSVLVVTMAAGCSTTTVSAPAPNAASTTPDLGAAAAESGRPRSGAQTTEITLPSDLATPPEATARAGDGIGSIEIPRIGLTRYMFEGIELSTLDQGPGHWPGTAMPGEAGNVVVAGHRVSHNADFGNLHELSPEDEVIFNTEGGRHVYSVESTEIVEPDALWIVDQTRKATATLFACHPPGSVSQRIVVHLRLED
ncbi:MAG: class E sortase [Actinomycetota bacterium]|nr:class E sortase [Actinomycetota bacterium]